MKTLQQHIEEKLVINKGTKTKHQSEVYSVLKGLSADNAKKLDNYLFSKESWICREEYSGDAEEVRYVLKEAMNSNGSTLKQRQEKTVNEMIDTLKGCTFWAYEEKDKEFKNEIVEDFSKLKIPHQTIYGTVVGSYGSSMFITTWLGEEWLVIRYRFRYDDVFIFTKINEK